MLDLQLMDSPPLKIPRLEGSNAKSKRNHDLQVDVFSKNVRLACEACKIVCSCVPPSTVRCFAGSGKEPALL